MEQLVDPIYASITLIVLAIVLVGYCGFLRCPATALKPIPAHTRKS